MTVTSDASRDRRVTARHKSALLWGVVGALLFLVLHQGYLLLLDGRFLGVGPVAGVALAVFAATTVGSYYTAGHLETFESDGAAGNDGTDDADRRDAETTAESGANDGADDGADDESDGWVWGGEEGDGSGPPGGSD